MQLPNQPPDKNNPEHHHSRKIGRGMYAIAWILGVVLLTLFFSGHEKRKINPNQSPESRLNNGATEVVLQQNRQGHYVTNGSINDTNVVFLLDTGATDVSIPAHIAKTIGLKKGRAIPIATANGNITVYQSWIEKVTIGDLVIEDVDANINPEMEDDFILLGMSALKKIEFTQKNDKLTLKSY